MTIRVKLFFIFSTGCLALAVAAVSGWYAFGHTVVGLVVGSATGILIATMLVFFYLTLLSRTLNEYLSWSAGMAEGNYDHQFQYIRKEKDLQQFFSNIKKLNKGMGKQTGEVKRQAQFLAEMAQKISGSTEQISGGSKEQAKEVQALLHGIEQMAAVTRESAEKAESTAGVVNTARQKALTGLADIEKLSQGMELIETRTHDLHNVSGKIGQIVEVIEGIAAQTNLLALNAAIESARAGEHGRGFAVVANEVRSMAENSGKSSKETVELITEIRNATAAATGAVTQGITLANEAGTSFKEISKQIDKTLVKMQKLAAESTTESAATETMLVATEIIAAVTQEAVASTEEVAESTRELFGIAEAMKKDADLIKQSFAAGK